METWNEAKIEEIVKNNKLVVFGKGTAMIPQCGFSSQAFAILHRIGHPFEVVNIFDHEDIRPSLIAYSNWPTTPQVFLNGEFLGGGDILLELYEKGELQKMVDQVFAA